MRGGAAGEVAGWERWARFVSRHRVPTLVVASLVGIATPLLVWTGFAEANVSIDGWQVLGYDGDAWMSSLPVWSMPALLVGGILLLFVTLHIVRLIGRGHAQLAKHMLVKGTQQA